MNKLVKIEKQLKKINEAKLFSGCLTCRTLENDLEFLKKYCVALSGAYDPNKNESFYLTNYWLNFDCNLQELFENIVIDLWKEKFVQFTFQFSPDVFRSNVLWSLENSEYAEGFAGTLDCYNIYKQTGEVKLEIIFKSNPITTFTNLIKKEQ